MEWYKWREDEEEDVINYWMTLEKREITGIRRTSDYIAFWELAIEEAMDLS
jgi:hypothetical protein